MKTILRLATLALAVAAALALAGDAFATQRIAVSQTATALKLDLSQDQSDPQPAKIAVYVPASYQLHPTGAVGSTIGTTSGQVFATDPTLNIPLPLSGDVIVLDPAQHTTDRCSPGSHVAVWDLHLTVAGQAIDLPVYISATTGAETALGAAKIETCLGPTDVPAGTPGRSPNGAKLLSATFTVNNQVTPPVSSTRWTSLWTPYASGTGVPNPAGTVEARSIVGPGAATIFGKITNRKRKLLQITGRVTQGGIGVAGIRVQLLINSKARFRATTQSNGGYAFRLRNTNRRKTTTFFQAVVSAAARDITATGCASPSVPTAKCVSATAGPFTARSRKLRVRL
jgi:hypothetical protein